MGWLRFLSTGSSEAVTAERDVLPAPVRMIGFSSDGGLVGGGVSATTILGLSTVIRCLDIITNGVSQCDWEERRGTLAMPTSRIVARPHPDMTRRDWTSFMVASMALWDRGYILPTGGEDSEGVPINLLPLDPSVVAPASSDFGLQNIAPVPASEYWVGSKRVPRSSLIILNKGPLPGIGESAMGIIRLARIKFAEALAADGYASRYWQAGGPMDRALETDANMPETVAETLSARWSERRSKGPDYWPVLSGGLHAKQYGIDPTQQAAVEARRELVADIARYFGVPSRIVNAPTGDTETYATTESANLDLIKFTLQNYIDAIQDAITDLLPGGRRMTMVTDQLTRGPYLARAQAYQLATAGKAWLTPDDVREDLDLPPVENPDELNPPPPVPVDASGGNDNGGQG